MSDRLAESMESYVFPASFAQQRLWFLCQINPQANRAYHMTITYTVDGTLDTRWLRAALATLVDRHEILRTRFVLFDESAERFGGELCQVIEQSGVLPVLERTTEAERLHDTLGDVTEFRPDVLPLATIRLFHVRDGDDVLQLVAHHLIFDGWSAAVFMDELAAEYAAAAGGTRVANAEPMQYADFSEWQRNRLQELDADLGYWRTKLAGVPALDLPNLPERPARQSFRGARIGAHLPSRLVRRVERLAQDERATPFMVLLAAWQATLARRADQTDFAVGTPVAGRTRPELERGIGLYVNTVVVRADLTGDPTFRELVRRTRVTCLDGFSRQEVPFERIVQQAAPKRDLQRSPLFQVFFTMQAVPSPSPSLSGARLVPRDTPKFTAMFDLRLSLEPDGDALGGWLEYSTDLFDEPTACELLAEWHDLLEELLEVPDRPVELDGSALGVPEALDRRALQDHESPAEASRQPRTQLEAELLSIFRELLGDDHLDIRMSFFDCGGTSLLAVRAMRQIRRVLRVSIPVETIFSLTSVERLAAAIESPETVAGTPDSEGIQDDVTALWRVETDPAGIGKDYG